MRLEYWTQTDQLGPNLHIFISASSLTAFCLHRLGFPKNKPARNNTQSISLVLSHINNSLRRRFEHTFDSRRGRALSRPRPLGLTSLTQQWRRREGAELQVIIAHLCQYALMINMPWIEESAGYGVSEAAHLCRCDLQVCSSTAGEEDRRTDEQNIHQYLKSSQNTNKYF